MISLSSDECLQPLDSDEEEVIVYKPITFPQTISNPFQGCTSSIHVSSTPSEGVSDVLAGFSAQDASPQFQATLDQDFSIITNIKLICASMSTATNMSCSNLSDLPIELLYLIFDKLIDNLDYLLSCARVCVVWHSIIDLRLKQLFPTPFILLMYPAYNRGHVYDNYYFKRIEPNEGNYRLFNTQTRRTITITLPELRGRWFCTASPGWLLTSSNSPLELRLLNPLSRAQIRVPHPGDRSLCTRLFRVIASSSPLNSNCILFGRYLISDEFFGFCRPRDEVWTKFTTSDMENGGGLGDAIFLKGDFYFLGSRVSKANNFNRNIYLYRVLVDESNLTYTTHRLLKLPRVLFGRFECYLVELMGELLLVSKCIGFDKKKRIMIHKLVVNDDDENRWVCLRSLCGHAIYLTVYNSVSVYVGGGEGGTCRPNCVYFVEEDVNGIGLGHISVYKLKTEGFRNLDESTLLWKTALNWFTF